MIVRGGMMLVRDNKTYKVICADTECFVIAPCGYDSDAKCVLTHYKNLEAYTNDETINTLADLRFKKLNS